MVSYLNVIYRGSSLIIQIALGFILTKFRIIHPESIHNLNQMVFKTFFFPMILRFLLSRDIRTFNFKPFLLNAAGAFTTQVLFLVIFFLPIQDKFKTFLSIILPAVAINYLIIGIPFFNSIWDPNENVIVSIVTLSNDLVLVPIYLIESAIYQNRLKNTELVENGQPPEKFSFSIFLDILKNLAKNPIIIANAVGFVYSLSRIPVPIIVDHTVNMMANVVLFFSLFCVGGFISQHPIMACGWVQFIVCAFARHFVMPLIILLYAHLFNLSPRTSKQCVVLSCLPSAAVCFMLAEQSHVGSELASTMIFFSIILAIPAIIFWLFIFDALHLFVETDS